MNTDSLFRRLSLGILAFIRSSRGAWFLWLLFLTVWFGGFHALVLREAVWFGGYRRPSDPALIFGIAMVGLLASAWIASWAGTLEAQRWCLRLFLGSAVGWSVYACIYEVMMTARSEGAAVIILMLYGLPAAGALAFTEVWLKRMQSGAVSGHSSPTGNAA